MESEDMEILSGDYFGQKFGWEMKRDETVVWGGGVEGLILCWIGRNWNMFGSRESGCRMEGKIKDISERGG